MLGSVGGMLRQRAHDERCDRRRDARRDVIQRRRRLGDVRRHELLRRRLTSERVPPREQLVRDHAPRVEVGSVVHLVAAHLLGRHVGWRAQRRAHGSKRARSGRLRRRERLRDAEVRHHRRAPGTKNVLGLDVTMHDAVRVRVFERRRHVAQHRQRLVERERASVHPHAERLAAHERHAVVRQSLGRDARGEHRHDVGLLQRGREPDLAREAVGAQSFGQLRREHLEHDVALKRHVARHEDTRHATTAEFTFKDVCVAQRVLELIAEIHGASSEGSRGVAAKDTARALPGVRRRARAISVSCTPSVRRWFCATGISIGSVGSMSRAGLRGEGVSPGRRRGIRSPTGLGTVWCGMSVVPSAPDGAMPDQGRTTARAAPPNTWTGGSVGR